MAEVILNCKGQITIPVEVRQALGLQSRDRVVFTVMPDGTAVLRAKTRRLADLPGTLKPAAGRRIRVKALRIGRR